MFSYFKRFCAATALALCAASVFVPTSANAATFNLSGTVRDFSSSHPDFENYNGVDPGIVEDNLGGDKKPVYAGLAGNPSTSGQTNFDQWYRDVGGVNQSTSLGITLDNTITVDPNVYTYVNNDFFPIDGQLMGNEGNPHNYHFTYEIHSSFTYQGGEEFTFTGDDDVFVFINDQLVIDLGGVHAALTDSVSLDAVAGSLGLVIGNDYDFDLFFAERHTSASSFRIDTSIALQTTVPEPGTYLLMGSLLTFAWAARRKRAPDNA